MKIGFVDDYLDNWHSNHYPSYVKLASDLYHIPASVCYAYAWRNHPEGGMTTEEWCDTYGVTPCASYEELIEKSDAIMVMCADNCLPHEELAKKALESGKPVFCDKTFAPDLETAKRMFALAEVHGTRMFSCSAQRFCMELLAYQTQEQEHVDFCTSYGPGDMVNYSVHQIEMLESLMGIGAKRCIGNVLGDVRQIIYEYENGRTCVFQLGVPYYFKLNVRDKNGEMKDIAVTDFYLNFMLKLLRFFDGGELPVAKEDTLEVMAIQQAGREALAHPGNWITLPA